ncbi:MAG TPA: hypothetical protein VGI03_14580 [Verrucomicrobiae bacterium]
MREGRIAPDGAHLEITRETALSILDGMPPIELLPDTTKATLPLQMNLGGKNRLKSAAQATKANSAPNRVAALVSHLPWLIWILRYFHIEGESGAGDTLARLLHKIRLVKLLNGRRCRCDDGRRWLNHRFPYPHPES